MKTLKLICAIALLMFSMVGAQAQEPNCPPGMTGGSCNVTVIGDRDYDGSQTVGDTINPTYSPDSASASASTGAIDVDSVGQGGTASSTSTGNTSTNNNQSSANNSATNNMTNGSITNDVTGGNITSSANTNGGNISSNGGNISSNGGNITGGTQGDQTQTQTGSYTQTQTGGSVGDTNGGQADTYGGQADTYGGQVGDTTGGTANTQGGQADTYGGTSTTTGGSVGDTNGGVATTNSGDNSSHSGVSDSGNSRSTATGGSSRAVTGASTSRANGGAGGRATGGASNSGGNVMRGGNTTIDASQRTTIKHAANTAAMSNMQAYGPGNCFVDTNPSGGFQASIQTFGWGVAASSHKASNVCAINQIMGSAAASQYLMKMDPNARDFMKNNPVYRLPDGTVLISKEEVDRRKAEQAQLEKEEAAAVRRAQRAAPTSTKTLACPNGFVLFDRGDKMVCRQGEAAPVQQVQQIAPQAASAPVCPQGSTWDGKGCYAKNLKNVRR